MKRSNYSFKVLLTATIFLITPLLMDMGVNAQPGNKDKNAPPSHHPRFWTINGNKTGDIDFLGTTNYMPINFKTADSLRMLISPLGDVNMFGNLLVNKKITGQAMRLTGLSGNKGMLAVDENGDLFRKDFETDTFVFHDMQTENLKIENNFQIGNTIYANVDPATKDNYIYTDSHESLFIQYPPSDTISSGHLILGDSTGTHNVGVKTSSPQYDLDVNGDINFSGNLLKNGQKNEFSPWGEETIHYTNNGYYAPDTVFNKVITTPLPHSQNGIDKFYFYSIGINTRQPKARLEVVGKDYKRYSVDYSSNIRLRDIFVNETYGEEDHYVWDIINDRGSLKFLYGYGNNNSDPSTSSGLIIDDNGRIGVGKDQYDQIMPKYELHIQKINGKIAFGDNNPYENPSSNGGINCFVGEYLPPNDNNDSDILHIHGKKGIIFTGGNYMEDNDNIPGNGNGEKIVMEITYNNHDDHVEAKIDGYLEAEDIKVKDVVTADYVFEKDYPLKNIDSLALYIQQQGHLPDMPSAGEMKENGIGLAKMNGRLLQKIEELTLYTIQQQKRIKDLAKKNEKLKEQNEKINEVMKDIEKLKAKMEE